MWARHCAAVAPPERSAWPCTARAPRRLPNTLSRGSWVPETRLGLTSLRSDTPSQGIVIVACAATKHQYMGHPITRTGPARGPLTKPNYLYIMCLSVYGVPRRHSRHVYFIAMYSQYSLRGSIERAYWPTCDRCRSRSFLDFFSVHCPKLARARHHLCVASSLTASPHRTAPRRPLSILVARGDRATAAG